MKLTIKAKLTLFPAISLVITFAIVGIGWFYYDHIEDARASYDKQTEQSYADSSAQVENAYDQYSKQMAEGMDMQARIMDIVQVIQRARISGKAYLKFYEDSHRNTLFDGCKRAVKMLEAVAQDSQLDVTTLTSLVSNYRNAFAEVVGTHAQNHRLSTKMASSLDEVGKQITALGGMIQEKEFELMMEGETLDSNEKNLQSAARDSRLLSLQLETNHRNFLLTGDVKYVEQFRAYFDEYGVATLEVLSHLAGSVNNDDYLATAEFVKTTITKNVELFSDSQKLLQQEVGVVKAMDDIGAKLIAETESVLADASAKTKEVETTSRALIAEAKSKAQSSIMKARDDSMYLISAVKKNAISAVGIGCAIGAAILIVLSALLIRSVTSRIGATILMLKDIAEGEGDLTKRLPTQGNDEISELGRWFNRFIKKLQGIVSDISSNAGTLIGSSGELSATARQLSDGATETTRQSAEVSAAAERMSTSMRNMSSSTDQMTANIQTIAGAIDEMTTSIAEVARNADQAASVAGNASRLAETSNSDISQLGSAADEIGKVIGVIQDIAEQTNLLALNATIEAARAGEAGKGFAVVATEVKELARQTAEATEDIRKRVEGIQSSTSSAVQSIGEIGTVIQQINGVSQTIAASVDQQNTAAREIAQRISETSSGAEVVSSEVFQTAQATEQITKNIARVDDAANRAASGANDTQSASQGLSRLADRLSTLVAQFKV